VKSIVVAGASLAGLSAVRALRAQGYDGHITVVGDETRRPYDRPPLSKELLAGSMAVADLALEMDGEDLDADWLLGVRATRLDTAARIVELSSGRALEADGVVLATGARARRIERPPSRPGVHVLRTVDDALALRDELVPGVALVAIGAGFIGAEIASTAKSLGAAVTVVEAAATPLSGPLGLLMGAVVAGLHARHGVDLVCGVGVEALTGVERVTGVRLADGRQFAADVVVVGVGAVPNIEWLDGSGLAMGNGVLCESDGATSVPNVVAVGDCSAWRVGSGDHRRIEHWTAARDRPAIAVARLLAGGPDPAPRRERAPYFWSDQYGKRIQFAGHALPEDAVDIETGNPSEGSFLAVYRRDGAPVAVLGIDQVREFTRWRRQLA
jgi:NADPH-dependent 2,4-dienoyl-CoA reductase/sulfur reductase-like enzyme